MPQERNTPAVEAGSKSSYSNKIPLLKKDTNVKHQRKHTIDSYTEEKASDQLLMTFFDKSILQKADFANENPMEKVGDTYDPDSSNFTPNSKPSAYPSVLQEKDQRHSVNSDGKKTRLNPLAL